MKFPKSLTTHFSMVLRLKKFNRLPVIVICLLLITGGPSMVRAEGEGDIVELAGLGVASVILTIPYGSAKIVYAGIGSIVGGATWALTGGNNETAQTVWEPSLYGDYVITPDHILGKKPLRFFGVTSHQEDTYEDPYAE